MGTQERVRPMSCHDAFHNSTLLEPDPYEPTTLAEAAAVMTATPCPGLWSSIMPAVIHLAPNERHEARTATIDKAAYLRAVLARADLTERGSPEELARLDAQAMDDLAGLRSAANRIALDEADES